MKDNRQSILPKVAGNKEKTNQGSNQSNLKSNQESKNWRNSTQFNLPRATTFSSLNKSSDPRPIKDSAFQDECYEKVVSFFIKFCYDKPFSKKELANPITKDYISYLKFVLNKIRPDWNLNFNNNLSEDLMPILNELRYPGHITKNHLSSIGAPTAWPHFLALLSWLCELATYLQYEADKESTEFQNKRESCDFIPLNNQEKEFEQNFNMFLFEGYKNSNKNDNFVAIENFQKKTDELVNMNYQHAEKYKNNMTNYQNLSEKLETDCPDLMATTTQLEEITKEYNSKVSHKNSIEKRLNELIQNLEKDKKIYDSKCEKNSESNKALEDLENVIKNQKVSHEDFEKLKHNRSVLEKQNSNLMDHKNEVSNSLWQIQKNFESLQNNLIEKIKATNIFSERNNLPRPEIINLISNELINFKNTLSLNLDTNLISADFASLNSNIQNITSTKINQVKEREGLSINLKSDLLKIEDEISEANEKLNQKSIENEKENNLLTTEKEKYSNLNNQKIEEIRKINENVSKVLNLISDKEKELEEAKQRESALLIKYQEEEDKTDLLINQMHNEYTETEYEMKQIKNDNILKLRILAKKANNCLEAQKKLQD
jgi:kinetochore protein NDC80